MEHIITSTNTPSNMDMSTVMDIALNGSIHSSAYSYSDKFDWKEYAVFSTVLVFSAGIGVFYGCFGNKMKSTEEYLMADRKMSAFPVAMSLFCSFVSAITLLGHGSEIYLYGAQHSLLSLSFIPLTIVLAYFYVPVYFNLQVGSAYEYLEYRFNSNMRFAVSLLGILYWMIYMAVVVYGPALALNQVTGMSVRISTAVIFLVCIFYSSIGGLKAVLWTDTFQALLIFVSMSVVTFKGIYDLGGFSNVWDKLSAGERNNFFNFDVDPRTRHTVWTALVGGYFWYMALFAATQAQVQRYLSMPDMATVKRALFMNMIAISFTIGLCTLSGFVLYAKYADCDPVLSGAVKSSDQMLPLFVMQTMGDLPGLPGLFVAGITCGSLSTISSGLNAVAAIITYDYLVKFYPSFSDERLSNLSKVVCIIFGLISYALVFAAEHMGNLVPVWNLLIGMILGPSLGVFTLGMFFPWANSKGSLLGVLANFFLMVFIVVGAILPAVKVQLPDQKLSLSTSGCDNTRNLHHFFSNVSSSVLFDSSMLEKDQHSENLILNINNNSSVPSILEKDEHSAHIILNIDNTSSNTVAHVPIHWKDQSYDPLIQVFSISYVWYSTLACVSTVAFGLLFSLLFNKCDCCSCVGHSRNNRKDCPKLVKAKYLSPPMLFLWKKIFSQEYLSRFVQFHETDSTSSKNNIMMIMSSNQNELSTEVDVFIPQPRNSTGM